MPLGFGQPALHSTHLVSAVRFDYDARNGEISVGKGWPKDSKGFPVIPQGLRGGSNKSGADSPLTAAARAGGGQHSASHADEDDAGSDSDTSSAGSSTSSSGMHDDRGLGRNGAESKPLSARAARHHRRLEQVIAEAISSGAASPVRGGEHGGSSQEASRARPKQDHPASPAMPRRAAEPSGPVGSDDAAVIAVAVGGKKRAREHEFGESLHESAAPPKSQRQEETRPPVRNASTSPRRVASRDASVSTDPFPMVVKDVLRLFAPLPGSDWAARSGSAGGAPDPFNLPSLLQARSPGRTSGHTRAANSSTPSIFTDDAEWRALCTQQAALRVVCELWSRLQRLAFEKQRLSTVQPSKKGALLDSLNGYVGQFQSAMKEILPQVPEPFRAAFSSLLEQPDPPASSAPAPPRPDPQETSVSAATTVVLPVQVDTRTMSVASTGSGSQAGVHPGPRQLPAARPPALPAQHMGSGPYGASVQQARPRAHSASTVGHVFQRADMPFAAMLPPSRPPPKREPARIPPPAPHPHSMSHSMPHTPPVLNAYLPSSMPFQQPTQHMQPQWNAAIMGSAAMGPPQHMPLGQYQLPNARPQPRRTPARAQGL